MIVIQRFSKYLQQCKDSSDFWKKFETFLGDKFPPCVVTILKENGYTSSKMVADITSDDVTQIEEFTDKNYRELITSLSCCNAHTYQKQDRFKFLPGHRSFILRLPIEIERMKQSSSKRPYTRRDKDPPLQSNDNADMQNESNFPADDEEPDIANELQQKLVDKLKRPGGKKQRQWVNSMDLSIIKEIELTMHSNGKMKTAIGRLICPFCAVHLTVVHGKYWRTSNLLKHFDTHTDLEKVTKKTEDDEIDPFEFNTNSDDGAELSQSINRCINVLDKAEH